MFIFSLLLKGILIGAIVSAPMGPVGLVCLKETLQNGRKDGLLTGLGAALSDTFYSIMSYMSIGIVLAFMENHSASITLLGSLLLFGVGYYLYVSVPHEMKDEEEAQINAMHGFKKVVSSFLITLSNPLIIFFFLSLFSRFNFVNSDDEFDLLIFILSNFSVFLGCMIWWYILTYWVAKLRNRLQWKYIRGFNRLLALIIVGIAIIGVISSVFNFMNSPY